VSVQKKAAAREFSVASADPHDLLNPGKKA
jgi:hypothetical protein